MRQQLLIGATAVVRVLMNIDDRLGLRGIRHAGTPKWKSAAREKETCAGKKFATGK